MLCSSCSVDFSGLSTTLDNPFTSCQKCKSLVSKSDAEKAGIRLSIIQIYRTMLIGHCRLCHSASFADWYIVNCRNHCAINVLNWLASAFNTIFAMILNSMTGKFASNLDDTFSALMSAKVLDAAIGFQKKALDVHPKHSTILNANLILTSKTKGVQAE